MSSDNLSMVAHLIVDLTVSFFDAEIGSLMLVDNRKELSILCSRGLDPELTRGWRGSLGEGIAGNIAANATPIICRNAQADPRFNDLSCEPNRFQSLIACPIIGKDRILGVLNIMDKRSGRPFVDGELEFLKAVAGQVALALEKIILVREFQQKTVDIEEANRRLITQDLAKTEFLTRVSHELRTPLNAIKGAVHLLQNSDADDITPRREYQDIVAHETERLLAMVNRQLDFLHIEDESRILRKTFLSLETILRDCFHVGVGLDQFSYKKLDVALDIPNDPVEIVGDKILVGQMFVHLLDGLATFLSQPARLRVSIRETETITVIFQIFETVPHAVVESLLAVKNIYSSDRPEDSIKFYLAMKVAESHGWRLGIGNAEEGFRVSLQIPRAGTMRRDAALSMVMDRALGFVSELLGVEICSLMLSDDLTGELTIRSSRGLDDWIVKQTRIRPGDRIAGWVALEGRPVLIEDIEADPRFGRKNLAGQYHSKSLLSLPLVSQGRTLGVLNLNNKSNGASFTQKDLALASTVCERVSLLIEKTSKSCECEGELRELVAGLDTLVAAENRYRKKHERYAELMSRLMEKLGASNSDIGISRYIAQVYDLGLMLIDDRLLVQKGPLSPVENLAVKKHPSTTLAMLESIEFSGKTISEAILYHHERFDGRGYPDGLKGDDIPLMARVLAVVDAFCALTEPRPHREALSPGDALQQLQKNAGKFYDPRVVDALQAIAA